MFSRQRAETLAWCRILGEHVRVTCAGDLPDLRSYLGNFRYDALFWAWSFQQGAWEEDLEEIRDDHPDLPVILLSQTREEKEGVEAMAVGTWDWLAGHEEAPLASPAAIGRRRPTP